MSKRNSQQPALPDSAVTMGLDSGYGVVKAVTSEQVAMFPSMMEHAREIKFQQDEITERHPGNKIEDEEVTRFVGDSALVQLPPGEQCLPPVVGKRR